MFEAVPSELKELKHWCGWKFEQRNNKTTKVPINAYTGDYGRSNDESTWSDFQTALSSMDKFNCDGIGFYFKQPYFGIDLDNVKTEIDRYIKGDDEENLVADFVDLLGSYSEISPSGSGIHIIAKGELPDGGRRKGNIEVYDSGRFFTVTGNKLGDYNFIVDDSDYGKINYLHNKYIASSEPSKNNNLSNDYGNDLSIDRVIEIAQNSKNGMRFKLFMVGGWEQFYHSQSEADMAFANDLAFWTNRDFEKMDSIVRRSSLYRDKWDRKTGDSTYGEITLNKAIRECRNVFTPKSQSNDFNLYVNEYDTKEMNKGFIVMTIQATQSVLRKQLLEDIVRYSYTRKNWYFYNDKT